MRKKLVAIIVALTLLLSTLICTCVVLEINMKNEKERGISGLDVVPEMTIIYEENSGTTRENTEGTAEVMTEDSKGKLTEGQTTEPEGTNGVEETEPEGTELLSDSTITTEDSLSDDPESFEGSENKDAYDLPLG